MKCRSISFETNDAILDTAWSELAVGQFVCACGAGEVLLFDLSHPWVAARRWMEHRGDVMTVNWGTADRNVFVTGSIDGSLNFWHPEATSSVLSISRAHNSCVYSACFSPRDPRLAASCSQDGSTRIWDYKAGKMIWEIRGHQPGSEVLALDWNKYQEHVIATGATDREILLWDLRSPGKPYEVLGGQHDYAVRRLRWSPFDESILASVSYDMSMALWDAGRPAGEQMFYRHHGHTEFVFGVAFSLHSKGRLATCGWDEKVHILQL